MPSIPETPPPVVSDASDEVVASSDDVLAAMPGFVQKAQGQPAPVRDALVVGLQGTNERYQDLSAYAADQCDVLHATDQYLVGLGEDRSLFKQPGESDDDFRARMVATPSQVSPQAIIAAVNAILAPFGPVEAQYLESALDRWFVTDGTAPFHSFCVGLPGAAPGDACPSYPDRHYRDDFAAGLSTVEIPNRDPGGPWAFDDNVGRYFVIRVPVVTDTELTLAFAGFDDSGNPILLGPFDVLSPELGGTEAGAQQDNAGVITTIVEPPEAGANLPTTSGGRGMFVGDGSNTGGAEADGSVALFAYDSASSVLATYQAIVNAVERLRGHGVRWQLIADPNLVV